jgi:hypothetical protein
MISSILIGTGNTCATYQAPNKKQKVMTASDLTTIKRLHAVGAGTTLNQSVKGEALAYDQINDIRFANRVSIPLAKILGQNFQ